MKNIIRIFTIISILCFTLIFSVACVSTVQQSNSDVKINMIETNIYPTNKFTNTIPKVNYGEVMYLQEFIGDDCRYAIGFTKITREEGNAYIDILKSAGYKVLNSTIEDVSAGYILTRNNVQLSISISENNMVILFNIN